MPSYNQRTKLRDEDFVKQFQRGIGKTVNDKFMDTLDDITLKADNPDDLKRQAIRFSKVIKEIGNISPHNYLLAVYFCSLYAQNYTQEEAYRKVFPDRVAAKREGNKTIANAANAYFHSMLVQAIWKQINVVDHILFVDKRFRAYAVLEEIMEAEDSTKKEKIEAAGKLITNLRPPKEALLRVDITKDNKEVNALEDKLAQMAALQINAMTNGQITNKDIVEAKLIDDEECEDAELEDDVFNPEIHDIEVYEKYEIIVKRID